MHDENALPPRRTGKSDTPHQPRGEGSSIRAKGFPAANWLLCIILALASTCSAGTTVRKVNGIAQAIPGFQLRPEDRVDDIDLLLDGSGDLHVAWSVSICGPTRTPVSKQVWYRLRKARTNVWSDPVKISERASRGGLGTIRIRRLGDELHILSGEDLQHFVF